MPGSDATASQAILGLPAEAETPASTAAGWRSDTRVALTHPEERW